MNTLGLSRAAAAVVGFMMATTFSTPASAGEPRTRVFLNGSAAPVFFNDGDSFRVLGGRHSGGKARLSGYNTLESFGPVHQWGGWTEKEMYVLAKMATMHARNGVWQCESDMETDTYGRTLWWCPSLAESLIREGLAHAMTITTDPANAKLLVAQAEAIAAKRGIWAHGVPEYVMTSTHSLEEATGDRKTYNRIVSSLDGHSRKWRHEDTYEECQKVCDDGIDSNDRVMAAVESLKGEASLAVFIADYDADALYWVVNLFTRGRDYSNKLKDAGHKSGFDAALSGYVAAGSLTRGRTGPVACVVHTDFRRRFGGGKAACLK